MTPGSDGEDKAGVLETVRTLQSLGPHTMRETFKAGSMARSELSGVALEGDLADSLPLVRFRSAEMEGSSQSSEFGSPRIDLQLRELLGTGGMGQVHAATQVALGRSVAVKQSLEGEESPVVNRALVAEARLLASLEHPNIPPVHILGRDEQGRAILVMKRIVGDPLLDLLADPAHAGWSRVPGDRMLWTLLCAVQIAHAVEYAHSIGVIHRDIKTDNVMIGDFGEVYLIDWGIAVTVDRYGLYSNSGFCGTPAYAAPEMCHRKGSLSRRTDVYLLGALLHELITGKPRHRGTRLEAVLFSAARSEPFEYDASVPLGLARICNRAMEKEPSARFSSVAEFREALEGYIERRASVAILEAGDRLVGELEELLTGGDGTEADSARVHALSIQCRFAFQQVMEVTPDSSQARRGLVRCIEAQFAHAVAEGNVQSARLLLDELRTFSSEAEAEAEAEAGARLDRLEEELEAAQRALAGRQDELSTQIQYTLVERLQKAEQRAQLLEEELSACRAGEHGPLRSDESP